MAITGIGNGYNNVYKNTYVYTENEEVKQARNKGNFVCTDRKSKE